MIVLVSKIVAKKEFAKDVENALRAMIPDVQNEPNALAYAFHRQADDPAKFLYYEQYTDKAALEFHGSTPYFKALVASLDGKLACAPEETFYELVESIKR